MCCMAIYLYDWRVYTYTETHVHMDTWAVPVWAWLLSIDACILLVMQRIIR
jgi:hypothetical protein